MPMKTSGIFRATATTAAAVVLALAGGTAVEAGPAERTRDRDRAVNLSVKQETDIRAFFDEYGVATISQDRLIRTYVQGERWDSSNSESTPISTTTYLSGNESKTVNTYKDGSVNVVSWEQPKAENSRAISGCTKNGNSYSNCKVDFWHGLVAMSFRADYSLAPGANKITNQWAASWTIGGACSTTKNYFGRPSSTRARLEVQAQVCGVPYSTTFFLELAVGGNKSSFSFG
jgi:hypothetical protein